MLKSGDIIIGKWNKNKYYIITKIGEGGIGSVYKVTTENGMTYALKISDILHSITREYNILCEINEIKCIPKAYEIDDCIIDGKIYYFFIMEFISGKSLKDAISNSKISLRNKLSISLVVMDKLVELFNHGYMYIDIKPDNIYFDKKNKSIKLVDFGGLIKEGSNIIEYTPCYYLGTWKFIEDRNYYDILIFSISMLILTMISKNEFNPLAYDLESIIKFAGKLNVNSDVKKLIIKGFRLDYRNINLFKRNLVSIINSLKDSNLFNKTYNIINCFFVASILFFIFTIIITIKKITY